ncbi:MAG: hypothetical protein P2A85_06905 [Microcoleus anatoxicus]|uniref:hypothetical protein n=1 Tax=Microcoleus anatoxicus TaxID=2705319 RepID=UPI003670EDF7
MLKQIKLWIFPSITLMLLISVSGCSKVNRNRTVDIELVGNESKAVEDSFLLRFDTGGERYATLKPGLEKILLNGWEVDVSNKLKVKGRNATVNLTQYEETNGNQTTTSQVYEITPTLIIAANQETQNFKEYIVVRFPTALAMGKELKASSPSAVPEVRFQVAYYSSYGQLWFARIIHWLGIGAIVVFLISLPSLSEYLQIRDKFKKAIEKYVDSGGSDRTVLGILRYLKNAQKRELYVSFNLTNELDRDDITFLTDEGTQITLFSPYKNFLQENLANLEDIIIKQLNDCFTRIISNDVFFFVKGELVKKKHVFFEIVYVVRHTESTYTREGVIKVSQGFRGIAVDWNINIFINQKSVRQIQFSSFPADIFYVNEGASNKNIFDKMAETAFVDLNQRLQKELQIQSLSQ